MVLELFECLSFVWLCAACRTMAVGSRALDIVKVVSWLKQKELHFTQIKTKMQGVSFILSFTRNITVFIIKFRSAAENFCKESFWGTLMALHWVKYQLKYCTSPRHLCDEDQQIIKLKSCLHQLV